MRYARACSLIFCVFLTATTLSQADEIGGPPIFGQGKAGYIPQFTGTQRLGNSNIFQAGASLGVNTHNPQATLDVESADIFAILGSTSSSGNFAAGVIGRTASTSGNGVAGEATSTTGVNDGVLGRSASTSGIGVNGIATATTGNAYGVSGQTFTTGFGAGVIASANATTGNAFGVFGSSASPDGVAIFGVASATSGNSTAIVGVVDSTNGGVAGRFVVDGGAGLVLQGLSSNGREVFSVDANGNTFFAGNLSKASGSFKIDHPLDPANKYLSHSFVESPDMMDVYNGVVVLDAQGSAWVELPKYFQALNRDFRYQLTPLGAPGPNLYIAEEVTGNRFKISGGKPNGKVSWQVTGIRQDAYANAHRIAVEEAKPAEARGQYLHPELFGAPKERAIAAAHRQLVQPVLAATTAATP